MLPSKWENLSRCSTKYIFEKCNTCIRLWAEQILLVNIYFSILGMAFAVPFLCYFQKLQCTSIFLKSYFKLEKLILLSFVEFFFRYVHLKRHFKNISGEITWQSIKGKFDHWQKLELCKVIHSAELHWKR